jgi:hypothetical protein
VVVNSFLEAGFDSIVVHRISKQSSSQPPVYPNPDLKVSRPSQNASPTTTTGYAEIIK